VYIIQSLKTGKLYFGYTNDLKRRIKEHNKGLSFSIKPYLPYRLVYYEAYANKIDAQNREKQLKKFGQGIYRLKNRLRYSLQNN
jgi:putative endonuclease